MSAHRVTFVLLALAVLLAVPAPALAQEATPAGARPAGPGQPASGPGGTDYVFPAVRVTSLGDEPGGGRVFEPMAARGWGRRNAPCGNLVVLPLELQRLPPAPA